MKKAEGAAFRFRLALDLTLDEHEVKRDSGIALEIGIADAFLPSRRPRLLG
ncbi:hypothetical protein [Sphingobium sp. CFD-2]|uniref:hypothetical protein n=1 Tax=Sphingobium sp. CFD-2 TaxID=2878542 RepID=UPI00214C8A6F|nr:hypothetical protein [Sphingobium sp. CFD-2]